MKRGGAPDSTSAARGVLDAGVVLARLDRRRRSHAQVVDLFRRSSSNQIALHLSVVNLAEVLEHARPYSEGTGVDLVALVGAYRIELHRPDAEVARVVARLASHPNLSLADRFAAATAEVLAARLYTTDTVLAGAIDRRKVRVTLL
jgi:predicted nucleic acid-binding protein